MLTQPNQKPAFPNTLRVNTALLLVVVLGLLFTYSRSAGSAAQAQSSQMSVQSGAVVGEKCVSCHKPYIDAFVLETHGKSAKFLNDSRAATCETCHGAGTRHIENREKRVAAADIENPTELKTPEERRRANAACLQCHRGDRGHFSWQGSEHDRSDMSCMSCHSVHHTKLPQWASAGRQRAMEAQTANLINDKLSRGMLSSLTVEETCFRCHSEKRKAMFQRSTHLLRTENRVTKVTCDSCHNPHGGEGRRMLKTSTLNDTCFECHAEKRGPLLWEHTPVQESCLTCHTPHGSNNVALLTKRTHQLCQQCHINIIGRHPDVAGFDVFTYNKSCVNCHTQIHGSNHPSGRAFTR